MGLLVLGTTARIDMPCIRNGREGEREDLGGFVFLFIGAPRYCRCRHTSVVGLNHFPPHKASH